jgi:hypothetical protein
MAVAGHYTAISCRRQYRCKSCSVFVKATQNLGLAASASTTTGAANAVSVGDGWNDEGVQEKDSCSKYEQSTFHDCFLLVTGNWIVIFS